MPASNVRVILELILVYVVVLLVLIDMLLAWSRGARAGGQHHLGVTKLHLGQVVLPLLSLGGESTIEGRKGLSDVALLREVVLTFFP
jgi:hypothetical protein